MNPALGLVAPLVCVFAVSCAASTAPSNPPPDPRPSASGSARASVAATSSSAPAVTPAPTGEPSKVVFGVPVIRGEGVVGLSVVLPASYGIENSGLGPTLSSCSARQEIFGTRISVAAYGCEPNEAGADCVKRVAETISGSPPAPADAGADPLRRWIERGEKSKKSGEDSYAGELFAYDPTTKTVGACGYAMSRDSEKRRAGYQAICRTLAFEPTFPKPDKNPSRAPTPEGALGNADEVPNGPALASAALGFFDALSNHDMHAAEAFILGPDDCPAFAPKQAPEKCRAALAPTAFEANFDELAKGFPPYESAGATVLLAMSGSASADKKGPDVWLAYVLDKANPCKATESAFPVAMIGDKAKVLILMKAKK
ncbi:MAG: hypothetical protein U0414_23550 [Polyangiaceae bacterium]